MTAFNHQKIEAKWRRIWEKKRIYEPDFRRVKKPFYNLMMFPYPSAEGLHVGNVYAFVGSDIYGRFKRMQGYNVFEPIGLDGFGIHSENYALKIKAHPMKQAKISEKRFYKQLEMIGNGFAWNEHLETYDPEYYRWTQWIFSQMFKRGLAYRKKQAVNWCPSCKTVLADEQVINGKCERCSSEVVKKELEQWFFRITKYAERLLRNIERLDWSEKVKIAQRAWIGKSEGTEIIFPVKNSKLEIRVVTTRADTIFGATFVTIAPEHPLIQILQNKIRNYKEVEKYIKKISKKADFERGLLTKEKTGIKLEGVTAVNPVNKMEIPVYISDFVLMSYGTGAIMSVPAHDDRDFEFAKRFHLPILSVIEKPKKEVVGPIQAQIYDEDNSSAANQLRKLGIPREYTTPTVRVYEISYKNIDEVIEILKKEKIGKLSDYLLIRGGEDFTLEIKPRALNFLRVYIGDGKHINSGLLNGLMVDAAIKKMNQWLSQRNLGKPVVHYHLRDWLISRQRYWGPPIPMIYCESCAARKKGEREDMPGWYSVPENELPVKLPFVKNFQPRGTGQAPLASARVFYEVKCPVCRSRARRETDVSDTFLDSAWYFLRYPSVKDKKNPWNPGLTKKWLPVNMYIGGAEHSVLHLLYSRFLGLVFHALGLTHFDEPFSVFRAHGLLIKEGTKMSKSKGNVVNPDEYIKKFGADTLRMYLMFLAPFEQGGDFRDASIRGIERFLKRVWNLTQTVLDPKNKAFSASLSPGTYRVPDELRRVVHRTIKKTTESLELLSYNTAISQLMVCLNEGEKYAARLNLPRWYFEILLVLLAPFAPFLTEELWEKLGHNKSIHLQKWPKYDPKLIKEESFELVIQVNGKVRDRVSAPININQREAERMALSRERIKKIIGGGKIKKIIFVPNRLINIVF